MTRVIIVAAEHRRYALVLTQNPGRNRQRLWMENNIRISEKQDISAGLFSPHIPRKGRAVLPVQRNQLNITRLGPQDRHAVSGGIIYQNALPVGVVQSINPRQAPFQVPSAIVYGDHNRDQRHLVTMLVFIWRCLQLAVPRENRE